MWLVMSLIFIVLTTAYLVRKRGMRKRGESPAR
jgi:hypothetical protein